MSKEWNVEQIYVLIDKHKNENAKYHHTSNYNKRIFWKNIAEKLNQIYNTNYFTERDCNKKFLALTWIYYINTVDEKSSQNYVFTN